MIEVFSDGSASPTVMPDPYSSAVTQTFVTRGFVVAEALDLGLISQDQGELGTGRRGRPLGAEEYSIRLAQDLCARHQVREFMIYNDNKGAVDATGSDRVEWRRRAVTHLPNRFFEHILRRAAYLRQTPGRATRRAPLLPHQQEIFDLFNAKRAEFKLSDSALWAHLQRVAVKRPRH